MSYVAIRFVDGGRDRSGCDCWGLVRLFLKEEFRIDVPEYGEISARELLEIQAAMQSATAPGGSWVKIDSVFKLRRGNVIVMYAYDRVSSKLQKGTSHVGVMVDRYRLLHVEKGTDSVLAQVTSTPIRLRIASMWRHHTLQ